MQRQSRPHPSKLGETLHDSCKIYPMLGAFHSYNCYTRGPRVSQKFSLFSHPDSRVRDGSEQISPGHTLVLGVAPLKGSGAPYMCCLLPMFSSKMLEADNIADANAVISQTTDISKDSNGAAEVGGIACKRDRVGDESPPYPITPSPRQTNGFWQRPCQTGSTGQASTSDSEQRTRLRWAIDIKTWNPWDDEWLFLLDMLPEEDQKEVEAFRFKEDQKRALVSRLLQRQCVAVALGIPWEKVLIKRTKGRKPFLINKGIDKSHAPNFNFNVSHEGDYVVLASEPVSICGVDVAAPQQLRMRGSQQKMTIPQLKAIFEKQFTSYEWASIDNAGAGNEAKEAMFRRLWSLKEALVKARGDGLGFDLSKAEFHFEDGIRSDTASVWIDGQQQTRWRFFLQELSDGHWVSVARGPPENIVDAWQEFTGTLQQPVIPGAKFQEALEAPNPPFQMLQIADIIPQRLRDEYADAVGKI